MISFLSGDQEAGETAELKMWLAASPDNRAYFRTMREIWLVSGVLGRAGRFDKKRAYEQFLVRTARHRKTTEHIVMRRLINIASTVALLLIVAYAAFRQGGEQVKSRFADIVIEAPSGAKTKTILPDGTLIWLNAGSKISYSQGFGVDDRLVSLRGEGYFEVTRHATLPFFVNTEELQICVTGTKFNFSNYPDSEEAVVNLIDGAVQVNNMMKTGDERRLSADESAFLNKRTGQMRISGYETQHAAEWTNGFLFFDDRLLPDIVKILERSYNVNIRIADKSLESLRFYSEFSRREQTVEDVLMLLKSTGKLTYAVNGKEITLYARNTE